jgi:hypothetical protein
MVGSAADLGKRRTPSREVGRRAPEHFRPGPWERQIEPARSPSYRTRARGRARLLVRPIANVEPLSIAAPLRTLAFGVDLRFPAGSANDPTIPVRKLPCTRRHRWARTAATLRRQQPAKSSDNSTNRSDARSRARLTVERRTAGRLGSPTPSAVAKAVRHAADAIETTIEIVAGIGLEVAPCFGDRERRASLARGAEGGLEARAARSAGGAVRFRQVERDRARRTADLVGELLSRAATRATGRRRARMSSIASWRTRQAGATRDEGRAFLGGDPLQCGITPPACRRGVASLLRRTAATKEGARRLGRVVERIER